MSVQIKLFGVSRKARLNTDEAILKFASRLKIGDKKVSFIELSLKEGAVRGTAKYSMTGFQSVVVNVANGKSITTITKDRQGKSTSLYSTDFVYDHLDGSRIAYVPDTQFNRKVLVDQFHFGAKYDIVEDDIKASVKKDADALKKRYENARKKAFDKAEKELHDQKALFVKGLQEKIGDGFREVSEYKEEVGKHVTILAAKYFGEDKSWYEPKKPAGADA